MTPRPGGQPEAAAHGTEEQVPATEPAPVGVLEDLDLSPVASVEPGTTHLLSTAEQIALLQRNPPADVLDDAGKATPAFAQWKEALRILRKRLEMEKAVAKKETDWYEERNQEHSNQEEVAPSAAATAAHGDDAEPPPVASAAATAAHGDDAEPPPVAPGAPAEEDTPRTPSVQIQQMLNAKFAELTREEPRWSDPGHRRWQERMSALRRLPAMQNTVTWSRRAACRNTDGGVIWKGSLYGVGQKERVPQSDTGGTGSTVGAEASGGDTEEAPLPAEAPLPTATIAVTPQQLTLPEVLRCPWKGRLGKLRYQQRQPL